MASSTSSSILFLMASLAALALALFCQPSLGAVQQSGHQRVGGPKGMRLAREGSTQAEQAQQQSISSNSRLFYPSKLMMASSSGGFGPRMAAYNDWADPAEQFLSLKRASLLARLASQSARGFGRRK